MTTSIAEIDKKISPILRSHGVEYAAIFGSFSRGESKSSSDLDILVRYSETPGLLAHIGLAQTLEDAINTKVDLITEKSLSKYVASNVKNDLKVLYGYGQRPDLL